MQTLGNKPLGRPLGVYWSRSSDVGRFAGFRRTARALGRALGSGPSFVVVLAPIGMRLPDVTNDEFVLPGGSQTSQVRELLRERFPGGDRAPAADRLSAATGGLTPSDRARIVADARARPAGAARGGRIAAVRARLAPRARLPGRRGRRHGRAARLGRVDQHDAVGRSAARARRGPPPASSAPSPGAPRSRATTTRRSRRRTPKLLLATGALVLLLLLAVYRSPVLAAAPAARRRHRVRGRDGGALPAAQGRGLPVDSTSTSLVLVLMFGAGTDYCLLLVARYRAALRRGRHRRRPALSDPEAAPAMIASAFTVIAALLVMLRAIFGVNRTLGPVNAIGVGDRAARKPDAAARAAGRPRAGARSGRAHRAEPSAEGRQERVWRSLGERVRRRPAAWLAGAVLGLLGAHAASLVYHPTWTRRRSSASPPTEPGLRRAASGLSAGALAPVTALVERRSGGCVPLK